MILLSGAGFFGVMLSQASALMAVIQHEKRDTVGKFLLFLASLLMAANPLGFIILYYEKPTAMEFTSELFTLLCVPVVVVVLLCGLVFYTVERKEHSEAFETEEPDNPDHGE